MNNYGIISIGLSAGGLKTLSQLLPQIPDDFPIPIVVLQHRHKTSDNFLIEHLKTLSPIPLSEATQGETIQPNHIYIGPPLYHLLINPDLTFSLSDEPPICSSKPSIDVFFESVAWSYKNKAIGIILTGASKDGSYGLEQIGKYGGLKVVQDPNNAHNDFMPQHAIQHTKVDKILLIEKFGDFLKQQFYA